MVSFLLDIPPKSYMHPSCPSRFLHALPMSVWHDRSNYVPGEYKYRNLTLQFGGVSDETVKYGYRFCAARTIEWLQCKLQTRPLVREGAPQNQDRNFQTAIKSYMHPSYPPRFLHALSMSMWFDHFNYTWRRVYITKFLIKHISSASSSVQIRVLSSVFREITAVCSGYHAENTRKLRERMQSFSMKKTGGAATIVLQRVNNGWLLAMRKWGGGDLGFIADI
jgi:hypothetical protein